MLDGRDITRLAPEKRPIGMVFQHLALFPHMSVGENVAFSLTLKKGRRAEIRARVQAILELVGLGWAGQRTVGQLSGGQQQRVALARSLISEPEVLLLDEPLGALDLQIRREMQAELKHLQRKVGITFVFVTHDQTEAMSMSDRIVLMREGEIIQDAAPYDAYHHPADAFVASFVGETNLLEGTIVRDREGAKVKIREGFLTLGDGVNFSSGQRVQVSLRPESLTLGPEHGSHSIPGQAVVQSYLGHESLIEVDTPIGLVRVRGSGETDTSRLIGEQFYVTYDPTRLRVFLVA
jgi:ABC-type Fe3+/spermidine/putrescine transport system ATPase subunit